MTAAPLHMAGQRLMLDPAGVCTWPAQKLLAVTDLHLEKGSHFAARGQFVPPYDTRRRWTAWAPYCASGTRRSSS